MRQAKAEAWVVYRVPVKGLVDGLRAVYEQGEWDVMERNRPGYYKLIQANLMKEGEAEKLARATSGAARPKNSKRQLLTWPGEMAKVVAGANDPLAI